MQLSVVILNYNVRYFLELCLKSVEAAITDLDAEIIVVDNHSNDGSCQMVKKLFPNVILIENPENDGFSKGNNIGVAKTKGEYVCILNPDTVVAEDTFKIVLDFANSTPKMGILGCKLIDGKGNFLPESKRNIPTPLVSIKKILGNSKSYYANHLSQDEIGQVSVLVGAFMLLKQSIYNDINGFDEDYFMYGEDMDFSYRVEKAGYHNYYNPSTAIIHFKGESTLKDKKYAKRFNEAMQIFFKKHFKPNTIYNALIWLGIKGIIVINPQPKQERTKVKNYILMSDKMNELLQSKLEKSVQLYSEHSILAEHTQILFDTKTISFKSIIDFIINSKESDISFKFLLNESGFIIGSNSSKDRGEVIEF
ncbi:MAG: glycosyltransferase family 2 protein [Aquaticitalea sp.]